MAKKKLTTTTNDKLHGGNGHTVSVAPVRIEAAHEPLRTGEMPPFMFDNSLVSVFPSITPVPAPPLPIVPVAEPRPLKVAIIGTAPSSRGLAPFGDPSWTIWSCSAGNMGTLPRVDCWFEIHANLLWPENEAFGKPYLEWLNKQTFPVYMQDNSLVPRAMALPKDELVAEFGRYFFTSSFAWMMAFAMKCGAAEIGLWGVDMASRDEYILQRAGGHFFLQEAKKRNIKVTLPKESDLFQPPALYGFDDSTPFLRKIMVREKELKDRLGGMRQQRDQLVGSITYLEGALEDIDYIKSIWGGAQTHPGR